MTLNKLKSELYGMLEPSDQGRLAQAVELAEEAHWGQVRDDGTAYILHPLRVALIVAAEFRITETITILECVLHDVPEKSAGLPDKNSLKRIAKLFGHEVADDITVLTTKIGSTRDERDDYHIKSIVSSNLRVKLVKIADRLDNVRSLASNPDYEKVRRYIVETKRDFLPLARSTFPYAFDTINTILERLEKSE